MKRWIFTHLLPVFLVVVVIFGITIAAVPSFKEKFTGILEKFGPKADELTTGTNQCGDGDLVSILNVQIKNEKDENFSQDGKASNKDEKDNDKGSSIFVLKLDPGINKICNFAGGSDYVVNFTNAIRNIPKFGKNLCRNWLSAAQDDFRNSRSESDSWASARLKDIENFSRCENGEKVVRTDYNGEPLPEGEEITVCEKNSKGFEGSKQCKNVIDSNPYRADSQYSGPNFDKFEYVIKYFEKSGEEKPTKVFNSSDESLGDYFADYKYPHNFSDKNEYFEFLTEKSRLNSDPTNLEKQIQFKKSGKYEITTFAHVLNPDTGYTYIKGNTATITVNNYQITATADPETIEIYQDQSQEIQDSQTKDDSSESQDNQDTFEPPQDTSTITIEYTDLQGEEKVPVVGAKLTLSKEELDSENKNANLEVEFLTTDNQPLDISKSDNLKTNDFGKLTFKLRAKKEGTLKLTFEDEEKGVESGEIIITIVEDKGKVGLQTCINHFLSNNEASEQETTIINKEGGKVLGETNDDGSWWESCLADSDSKEQINTPPSNEIIWHPEYTNESSYEQKNVERVFSYPKEVFTPTYISDDGKKIIDKKSDFAYIVWKIDRIKSGDTKKFKVKFKFSLSKKKIESSVNNFKESIIKDTKNKQKEIIKKINNATKLVKSIIEAINNTIKEIGPERDEILGISYLRSIDAEKENLPYLDDLRKKIDEDTDWYVEEIQKKYSSEVIAADLKKFENPENPEEINARYIEGFLYGYNKLVEKHIKGIEDGMTQLLNGFGLYINSLKITKAKIDNGLKEHAAAITPEEKIILENLSQALDKLIKENESIPNSEEIIKIYGYDNSYSKDFIKEISNGLFDKTYTVTFGGNQEINPESNPISQILISTTKAADDNDDKIKQDTNLYYLLPPKIELLSLLRDGKEIGLGYNNNEFYPGDELEYKITVDNIAPQNLTNVPFDLKVDISDVLEKTTDTLSWHYDSITPNQEIEKTFRVKLKDSIDLSIKNFNITPYVEYDEGTKKTKGNKVEEGIWGWIEGNVQGVNNHPVPNAYITLVDKDNNDIGQIYDDGKDFQLTDEKGNYKLKFNRNKDLLNEDKVKIAVYLRDNKIEELSSINCIDSILISNDLLLDKSDNNFFTIKLNTKDKSTWNNSNRFGFNDALHFTETYYNLNYAKRMILRTFTDLKFSPLIVLFGQKSGYSRFGNEAKIIIDQSLTDSQRASQTRNIELHEYGHYIKDTFSNYDPPIMPSVSEEYYNNHVKEIDNLIQSLDDLIDPSLARQHTIYNPHLGIINDFSNGSVEEGFADFFSVAIEDMIENGNGDGAMNILNDSLFMQISNFIILTTNDIKQNEFTGSSSEENAFASLLWTLWKGWPSQFPNIQPLTFAEILHYFKENQIITTNQLYQSVNNTSDSQIQNLFRRYGFCKDKNQNWKCEEDEEPGSFANYAPFSVTLLKRGLRPSNVPGQGSDVFYPGIIAQIPFAREWRYFPMIIESYIKTNFVDNKQEKTGKLIVDIKFDPPYEFNNYSYEINDLDSGEKIFLSLLGGFYHTKAYIRAEGSNDYLVIDSNDYFPVISSDLSFNYLAEKTFTVDNSLVPTVEEIVVKEEQKQEQPVTQESSSTSTPTSTPTTSTTTPTQDVSVPTGETTSPVTSIPTTQSVLTLVTTNQTTNQETPISDNKIIAGETIDIKAENIEAKKIEVYLDGKKIAESPILTENFSFKVTPPSNTSLGTHTIKLLTDTGEEVTTQIKITQNNLFNLNNLAMFLSGLLLVGIFYFLYYSFASYRKISLKVSV